MTTRRQTLAACTVLTALSMPFAHGCKEPPPAEPVVQAAPEVKPPEPVAKVITLLKTRLQDRLKTEMAKGGVEAALKACQLESGSILSATQNPAVKVGRTSFKLRNPANRSPSWAESIVKASADRRVADVTPRHLLDLGEGRQGYLEVIGTQGMCLNCHGPATSFAPGLRDRIAELYPQDKAVGFAEGDVRGWFWAEFSPAAN
jgi:hypothetical protein